MVCPCFLGSEIFKSILDSISFSMHGKIDTLLPQPLKVIHVLLCCASKKNKLHQEFTRFYVNKCLLGLLGCSLPFGYCIGKIVPKVFLLLHSHMNRLSLNLFFNGLLIDRISWFCRGLDILPIPIALILDLDVMKLYGTYLTSDILDDQGYQDIENKQSRMKL